MMRIILMLLALLAAPVLAQDQTLSKADQSIFSDLAVANMAEVEWGKLALSHASADEVKRFGQRMVDEHGQALTQVQQLAQSKGVSLPTALDAAHQKIADKLAGLNGADFDKAYLQQAGMDAHRKVLSKLKAARGKAKDADLVALIDKLQPAVEQHLHDVPGKRR
ncbi:DUF4142 domain-containing protein [Massilia sp. TS11]|uniref:DUF4142 domain-containing protein n=1 Tax=Massilia sp. TS11 TaxID=2908003 RepID=UPI001EDBE688|nr:DUF4142 domain-containing protein [Massilia sp. TS11]MCG2585015.1 DUF4142 domain-containing protein [Massilia sp. TS11]